MSPDGRLTKVIAMTGPARDFAVTLSDGRRVIGNQRDGGWSVSVYAVEGGRLLGHGRADTRLLALERAGLCAEDAGEALGRAGI